MLSQTTKSPLAGGKPMLDAIAGRHLTRQPLWLMRQAGRYLPEYRAIRAECPDFIALCLDVDRAVEVTIQPVDRFGMDAAILFSDILMVPWALGQKLSFEVGEGPKLEPIRNQADFRKLAGALDREALFPVYESLRRLRRSLPHDVTLIGFAGAPWTLATYAVEGGSSRSFSIVKEWAGSDPDGFGQLIDRLTLAVTDHLIAQIDAGAECVQIFDSWAGALQGEAYRKWVIEPTVKIVAAVKAQHPTVPIIGFPKGSGEAYALYAEATGVDMVSLDPALSLAWIRTKLQPHCAVQGLLDPELLEKGGPPMRDAALAMLSTLGQGRYVFNLGHGVMQTTPPEHVAELVELVHSTPLPA